jgi:hypothetical protein
MCSNLNLTPINLRYIVYSWKTLNSQIEPVATDLFEIDKIERQVLLLLKMTTCKKNFPTEICFVSGENKSGVR